jgi:hypothetical protein
LHYFGRGWLTWVAGGYLGKTPGRREGGDFAGGGIKALVDGKLGRDAARERDRHRVLDELARRSASRARINA